MGITFSCFTTNDIPAVERFNKRFDEADGYFSFSDEDISRIYQRDEHTHLYYEFFLAKDENGEVRGGYYFKNQEFYITKKTTEIVFMQLPVSEGIIDKNYKSVGPLIFQDMEERRKLILVLGMGGFQHPLPKRLKKDGWFMYVVPFYFFINNVRAFLRDFEYLNTLRKSTVKKIIIKVVQIFGLLYILTFLIRLFSSVNRLFQYKKYKGVKAETVEEFSSFADEKSWESNKDFYSIVAKRDHHLLNRLYPKSDARFHKLKITKEDKTIGWTVMLCTKMENDKYFGNLTLGTIIDAFSKPADAGLLIYESVKYLKKMNAGLIVSNQANVKWGKHFKRNGFVKGPSNFIFGTSKGIKEYYPGEIDFENSFMMRGDGDGPINL